ncbi:MAG: hypothetical protein COU35_03625 [Candidatus Magasanikbacteria bacterium CG10_big_fil_rev_8_21_14_0_10_47_10]|uniref:PrgI family protein n=1 Tax=Candidatus Magasanikbacteria bacterium CG10_big_fil_rev_8_21_14_0_10_47_10 TaxID=1974652 RepID=A0A2H0TS38_9BACT|nr:MAG: hypothetical protein COU35_03625 [Candidatus Magasanikbacteria bacterium CG10_big_fil_rev_8_21_14_0_10_47_10]
MPQQFVVPQFIDVEDKIFGPVTVRQFLILVVAAGIVFIMYRLLDFIGFAISLALVGGAALVLAFVKINGQPFHYFLLNITQTRRNPRLRIWHKEYSAQELEFSRKLGTEDQMEEKVVAKRARPEHIRDLSLLVNTGGYYRPEE